YKPQKGDPLCLIRVLWRNSDYGFPVPRFEKFQGFNQVVIPALSVSPEFRILVYPYKFGDPVPVTSWNDNHTELTVTIKDKTDVYHFGKTDGGRTVLTLDQNNTTVLKSDAKPARPIILVRGNRFDINDLRYTRDENKEPTYLINKTENIQLERVDAPAQIRYTLDGTEPSENSTLYEKPILINKTCDLKAIVFNPEWKFGKTKSEVVIAHLVVSEAVKGLVEAPANSQSGLLARVYEKNTKLYNDKGFFEASKVMMPDLNKETAILNTTVTNFVLPRVVSKQPLEQQTKAFYRFSGLFFANVKGVYKFDINSCGPVTLDIANQIVIEQIGIFHQQQAHRQGEIVLDCGWHSIDLVICDPLFWNINSLATMPFEVNYTINGGDSRDFKAAELRFVPSSVVPVVVQEKVKWLEPINDMKNIESGFDVQYFDCTGKRRNN
ncbi:MAG: chitobiase/beta-hexosaminidase C-terminal domain-containing protein, partial [Bacteroidia bacterium]|nr:chitobiase/beta-hexosaminidase C-terminal domain-containing protein [Bacteroidia bacterium]